MKYRASNESVQPVLPVHDKDAPWVGCDLDGTLAIYDGWKGWQHIGEPVPKMQSRIKDLLERGIVVKILTARCSKVSLARNNLQFEQMAKVIQDWTEKWLGKRLEVVTEKDCYMTCFFDDSAMQVDKNTGEIVGKELPVAPEKDIQGGELKDHDSSDVQKQFGVNDIAIDATCYEDFKAGLIAGGCTSASDLSVTPNAHCCVGETNTTNIRFLFDTVYGNLAGEEVCPWLRVEVQLANGTNWMMFKLDKLNFKQLGATLAKNSIMNYTKITTTFNK